MRSTTIYYNLFQKFSACNKSNNIEILRHCHRPNSHINILHLLCYRQMHHRMQYTQVWWSSRLGGHSGKRCGALCDPCDSFPHNGAGCHPRRFKWVRYVMMSVMGVDIIILIICIITLVALVFLISQICSLVDQVTDSIAGGKIFS